MTGTRRVDRYLLGELLGSGGMGNVFLGQLLGPLGVTKHVAVKELHPHLAHDADFTAMMLEEARIQAALEHPNVVPVHDVLAREGALLLVLGLVVGPSLSEILKGLRERGERVPPRIAAGIALDVLEGLHAAHELRDGTGKRLGVVHRDVSPHNVLVADGVARVTDFGVAKVLDRVHVTRGGQLKGKPGYMSPEQLDGGEVDARSDVFATGLLLAEMVTGARVCPHNAVTEARRFFASELAEPAAWVDKHEIPGEIGPWLVTALDLDADRRPVSARAAALALAEAYARASAGEIATWVEEVAAPVLAEKRALVGRASVRVAEETATAPTGPARDEGSSHGVSTPPRHAPSRATPGAMAPLAIAAALAVSAFACGRWLREPSATSASSAPGVTTVAASPPPPASSLAVLVPAKPDEGPKALPASSLPASDPPRAARAARAAPRATTATPTPAVRTDVSRADRCTPPYDVEPNGVRVFKPECL